jgi:hypothetical protein
MEHPGGAKSSHLRHKDGFSWRVSSYSSFSGNCVEVSVSAARDVIRVRDSKDRSGPVLHITPEAWTVMVGRIRREFG